MNTVENIEQQLDEILEMHIGSNTRLLEIVKQERLYIIHHELDRLEAMIEEKLALKKMITDSESQRAVLMPHFCRRYGLQEKQIRLEHIIGVVMEPYKTRYTQKHNILKSLLQTIRMAHDVNKRLIQKSVAFHERSFFLLFGLLKENVSYGASGEMTHSQKPLVNNIV